MILGSVVALSTGPGKQVRGLREEVKGKHGKMPTYMEWDGKQVTLHPGGVVVPIDLASIDISDLRDRKSAIIDSAVGSTAFGRLLDSIESKKDREYLVVMVRPSGFHLFSRLRELIYSRGIDIGYEPLDQTSLFSVDEVTVRTDNVKK
jgi:hypothetical protein